MSSSGLKKKGGALITGGALNTENTVIIIIFIKISPGKEEQVPGQAQILEEVAIWRQKGEETRIGRTRGQGRRRGQG